MKFNELPVYREKSRILKALKDNRTVVIESPTGSGKTTQLPLILHEAGFSNTGVIGVTQPRRIAALSVSEFIASQTGTVLGGFTGYKMRFEDNTNEETRIKVMTDGILLQEIKNDPLLSRYSVIMVDEAHERSLNIDFILGLLKAVLRQRSDFKVIISSATINAAVFSEYFDNCPVVHIDTPVFPVQIRYNPLRNENDPDELTGRLAEIVETALEEKHKGDILIFLPGERNIKECVAALEASTVSRKLWVLPLYGRLSKEEQTRVFDRTPRGKTKVVVSTNIAETSVTIDGITLVIDPGRAKLNYYNPRTFTSSLIETTISRASANQRKGRAGRTAPGICYRLYSKRDFDNRPLYTDEEIYRTDLSEVVLRMADLGIVDFESFDFISPPGRRGIIGAVETLKILNALDGEQRLTPTGEMMARFPLLPRHARILIEAIQNYPNVMEEVLIATAFLSAHTPFLLPQGEELEARAAHHNFSDKAGDFVTYLKLFKAFHGSSDKEKFCESHYLDLKTMHNVVNIKEQLESMVGDLGIPISSGGPLEDYLCAVAGGLIQFVCFRTGRSVYSTLTAEKIHIHPGSSMFRKTPQYMVAGEIVKTSRMFARSVSPIQKDWLGRINPELGRILKEKSSGSRDGAGREKEGSGNDQEIRLGGERFSMKRVKKGKMEVTLPWETLKKALPSLTEKDRGRFRKLRGTVTYRSYQLLTGYKLSRLLKIATLIDPEKEFMQNLPTAGNMTVKQDLTNLGGNLTHLLKLTPLKKKSAQLGFITLFSDGAGNYWFKSQKSWAEALETTIASMELLADELYRKEKEEGKENADLARALKTYNKAYRRLNRLFENS